MEGKDISNHGDDSFGACGGAPKFLKMQGCKYVSVF